MSDLAVHRPEIVTDGGPWAEHDMACPVCWNWHDEPRKAVIDIGTAVFSPCDACRADGWEIRKRRRGHGRFPKVGSR